CQLATKRRNATVFAARVIVLGNRPRRTAPLDRRGNPATASLVFSRKRGGGRRSAKLWHLPSAIRARSSAHRPALFAHVSPRVHHAVVVIRVQHVSDLSIRSQGRASRRGNARTTTVSLTRTL